MVPVKLTGMKLDHIGIAVPDLETGKKLWGVGLGLPGGKVEVVEGEGVKVAFYDSGGGSHIELLEALNPQSPIAKFLEKRGPGIHHVCFEVPDLDAALRQAEAQGYRRIKDPVKGAHHAKVAFLHPKETGGVLLELAQK